MAVDFKRMSPYGRGLPNVQSSTEMQQLFFKEVVAPPSVVSFEIFIGSLEHGSIISLSKRMILSSEIIPSPPMVFSATRVNITTTIERSEQHATYSRRD